MGLFSEFLVAFGLAMFCIALVAAGYALTVKYGPRARQWIQRPNRPKLFTERELEFNKQKLEAALVQQAEQLYTYRSDESHRVFADYLRNALNLELLRLADGKVPDVDYAYHRGRIDSLRAVLNSREVAIQNKELLRKSEGKDPGAQEAKRSYVRAPATTAGLSI